MGSFFTQFYTHKWIFFYKLILSILKSHEKDLLQEDELLSIITHIKSQNNNNSSVEAHQYNV